MEYKAATYRIAYKFHYLSSNGSTAVWWVGFSRFNLSFQKDISLPSSVDMWHDITMKRTAMSERYTHTKRHTIQVDALDYMDELAVRIGCKPDFSQCHIVSIFAELKLKVT